jgi:cytochrome c-type biogenesis protein CcmE
MRGKSALIVSIAVVVVALGFLIYTGLSDNMVYYYHVDEYLAKVSLLNGERVKVNGKVSNGSIKKEHMDYRFVIHGSESKLLRVSYHGVVPDTFKEGSDVVVEGTFDNGSQVFHASTLMAKCPTKYEPQLKKEGQSAKKSESGKAL